MKKSTVKHNKGIDPKKKRSVVAEELNDSETRYQYLFESTKDGILILDAETGKIVDVNPFLIDLLGYTKEEFIEKSIWEIGTFQDIYENKEKFLELQQKKYVRYEDLPLVTSNGREILVEFVSNVYLEKNKKVIQCNIRDITARKETEATLEKTRKELAEIKKTADELNKFTENIIDTVREPLLAIDKDLRVIKASRSFYKFFKVSAEETIGKLIYELGNHQWNIPKLKELLEEIIPKKNPFDNYEVEHNFSTIGKRVMLLNARQVKRAFGKEKVILLAIEDITERKGKEDSLKETHRTTNASLNALLNFILAPIIVWDTSMVIKRFNRKFELLSGYESAEVIDKKIDFLFPKEKVAATLELLKNHLDDEHLEVVEIDILTKDNQIKTVLWNSSRVLDEDGEKIIATISQDITSRRQSELALQKSESHLRTLVKTIPDLIWLKDTNGLYLSCNPMFERFFGAKEADVIGKTDYDFVDRKLADFFRENDQKAMEAGKPTSNEEWVVFADDGHRAFLDTIKTPIYNSDGTLHGVMGIGRDITERKLAEQTIQASEERFRTIFDQAPIAFAMLDLQGHPIMSNSRLSKMLGYTKDEFSKMKFTEFTHPEDIDKDLKPFTDLITGKISRYNLEKRYIHKDGNLIWAKLFVTALNDNNGDPQEIIGMVEDVTEQKKAEEKLKNSEERFKILFDYAPDAYYLTDLKGTFIDGNIAAEKMLGYSKIELIGKNFFKLKLISPNQFLKSTALLAENLLGKATGPNEFVIKHKNGSEITVEISSYPVKIQDKSIVLGIARDITERKQAEKEIAMLAHSLKSINECVSITDQDNKILFVNESFLNTYGYELNELIGENISIVRSQSNEQAPLDEILPTTIQGEWRGELINMKKDGTEFPVYLSTTLIKDKENKVLGLIGVASDITERKHAETELIAAKEKAEESDRLKSAFLANMSHEIRTPMNGILGFTQLLLEPDLSSEEKEDYIKIVNQSGQRMLNTVTDIVEMSKIEAGLVNLLVKNIDFNERLEELFRFFKPEAHKKGIKLNLEMLLPAREKNISTDQNKLDSILTNLIKNAIKYTDSGTIQMGCETVKTPKTFGDHSSLQFYIKDTGIGVPKHRQEAIFDRFMQADIADTRAFQGSGLGLAISKSYVEMLGGKIWVESVEGNLPAGKAGGSTFYFTLPFKNNNEEKSSEHVDVISNNNKKPDFKKLKILIVEDDKTSLDYLSVIVKDISSEILKAGTAIDAIELCRNTKNLDLILMDIRMPGMDGYEATRRIREFNKDVVIIAQTAYALSGDSEQAIESGCNDYIAKPVKRGELIGIIKKYFKNKV